MLRTTNLHKVLAELRREIAKLAPGLCPLARKHRPLEEGSEGCPRLILQAMR